MKKTLKQLFFSVVCVMALATIVSCDKDNAGTGGSSSESPSGYVNLGLPSGTKWNSTNETNPNDEYNFYKLDDAMSFGDNLPTREQFEELKNLCSWTWTGNGYKIVGPNGKYINLPAAGFRPCTGTVCDVGSIGYYWSSTYGPGPRFDGQGELYFDSEGISIIPDHSGHQCCMLSVRLVQN